MDPLNPDKSKEINFNINKDKAYESVMAQVEPTEKEQSSVVNDKLTAWKPTKSGVSGSMIGLTVGIGYSVYKKTGFWKGLGLTILSQIAFANLFGGIEKLTKK